MKVLAIIESPFQLMCVYNFIKSKGCEYEIWARFSSSQNNKQIVNVASYLGLGHIRYFSYSKRTPLRMLNSFMRLVLKAKQKKYDAVIVGDYLSGFLSKLTGFINKEKVLLVDDGVATFKIQRLFADQNKKHVNSLATYTIFEIDPLPNQKVYKHNLSSLSELKNIEKLTAKTIYVGAKLVDLGLMKFDDYVDTLKTCRKSDDDELLYIAHRGETEVFHEQLRRELKNINIVVPDLPIELWLIKNNILPEKMYSFCSTAVYTIPLIFGEIQQIVFRLDMLEHEWKDDVKKVYEQILRDKAPEIIHV